MLARVIEGKEPQVPPEADPKLRAQLLADAQAKQRDEALKVLEKGLENIATKNCCSPRPRP